MRTKRLLIALVAVSIATAAGGATAQAPILRDPTKPCAGAVNPLPGETCGDHYLESVRITTNPISKTVEAFSDSVDTSRATTQLDMFKPGGNRAGPREPTSCNGSLYGRTVWYDLNPTVDGDVLVQAAGTGVDPVISLVQYDTSDGPNFRPSSAFQCSNQGAGALEQLTRKGVRRGRGYSIQVGGVGNRGGPVDLDLNFTPYRLRATPKLAFQLTRDGVRLVSLRVIANRKARIEVRCRGCHRQVKRGRRVKFKLGGRTLRAGSKLTIRVARRGQIGSYLVYKIRRRRIPLQIERCLQPGAKKPRKTCG